MKFVKLLTIACPCLIISACGSGDAIDAVEQAANNINNAVTDLNTAVTEGLENTNSGNPTQPEDTDVNVQSNPPTPDIQTRPEIFEDFQYSCNAYSDPANSWIWSFRPELDLADQFNLVTGAWEWVDNSQVRIRPQGNPEVLGTLSNNTGEVIFLESWGECSLRYGRSLAEQFTRPS